MLVRRDEIWWRRWESNPCPQIVKYKILHVCFPNIRTCYLGNKVLQISFFLIYLYYEKNKYYTDRLMVIIRKTMKNNRLHGVLREAFQATLRTMELRMQNLQFLILHLYICCLVYEHPTKARHAPFTIINTSKPVRPRHFFKE